jgi:hypothetical protein
MARGLSMTPLGTLAVVRDRKLESSVPIVVQRSNERNPRDCGTTLALG